MTEGSIGEGGAPPTGWGGAVAERLHGTGGEREGTLETPTEILVLEDDPIDRRRLDKLVQRLGRPVSIAFAGTVEEFAHALDRQRFDILLIDFYLGSGDGLEAMGIVRTHPHAREAIKIMVSQVGDTDLAVEAMRAGCSDFIDKSALTVERLRRAIDDHALSTSGQDLSLLATTIDDVERAVLREVSMSCDAGLRPVIARIFRRIESLRGELTESAPVARRILGDLDQDCMAMWTHLDALSRASRRTGS